jgi:RNA polymerase sigma-32 factor
MDLLEDPSEDQEAVLMEKESESQLSGAAEEALSKLDPRERFIIRKRFLEDPTWTLQKLGEHFGTSRERIRQLEKRALNKLKAEFSPQFLESLQAA